MSSDTASKPLVSIITVCYNLVSGGRVTHFKQCVTSVLEQTYTNIEHIIIDGGSQDGTVELLKSIKEQTEKTKPGKLWYISEPDKGIYDAMNKGIKAAKGKYIAFLNSDDYWHGANGVEMSVAALESNNAAFSYAPRTVVSESGDFLHNENSAIGIFAECMPFCHQTMFTRRDVLLEHKGFDGEHYRSSADYDLIVRIILSGAHGIYVPLNFTSFRRGGFSEHSNFDNELYTIRERLLGTDAANMLGKGYMDDNLMQNIIRKIHPTIALDVLRCHKCDSAGIFTLTYGLTQIDAKGRYKAGFEMRKKYQWKLFSILPILSMKQRKNRTDCFLLGFIPIGRVSRKFNKTTFLLFGILPIFSSSTDF